jgi:hypothetical protein
MGGVNLVTQSRRLFRAVLLPVIAFGIGTMTNSDATRQSSSGVSVNLSGGGLVFVSSYWFLGSEASVPLTVTATSLASIKYACRSGRQEA